MRYEILNSNYNKKEHETQSLDTKCEVCGGTREAFAIKSVLKFAAAAGPTRRRAKSTACANLLKIPLAETSIPLPLPYYWAFKHACQK